MKGCQEADALFDCRSRTTSAALQQAAHPREPLSGSWAVFRVLVVDKQGLTLTRVSPLAALTKLPTTRVVQHLSRLAIHQPGVDGTPAVAQREVPRNLTDPAHRADDRATTC